MLADTDAEDADLTGLEYRRIKRLLLESPAAVKIVILDCCYAGRAIEALATGDTTYLADLSDVHGVYTLTAADTVAHVAPLEQQQDACTSFTGELIDLVRTGISGGPRTLTLGALYPHLRSRLSAKGLPRPNQRGTDTADRFVFSRNPAADPPIRADLAPPFRLAGESDFSGTEKTRLSPAPAREPFDWSPFIGRALGGGEGHVVSGVEGAGATCRIFQGRALSKPKTATLTTCLAMLGLISVFTLAGDGPPANKPDQVTDFVAVTTGDPVAPPNILPPPEATAFASPGSAVHVLPIGLTNLQAWSPEFTVTFLIETANINPLTVKATFYGTRDGAKINARTALWTLSGKTTYEVGVTFRTDTGCGYVVTLTAASGNASSTADSEC